MLLSRGQAVEVNVRRERIDAVDVAEVRYKHGRETAAQGTLSNQEVEGSPPVIPADSPAIPIRRKPLRAPRAVKT